jgi:hypothetical protein
MPSASTVDPPPGSGDWLRRIRRVECVSLEKSQNPKTTRYERRSFFEETPGIPTGLAPYIHRQVEIRKTKRKPAPDNLAPESPA